VRLAPARAPGSSGEPLGPSVYSCIGLDRAIGLLRCRHEVGIRRPIVADGGGADSIPVRVGLSHSSGVT
jgi:hypothetical protein